MSLKNMMVMLIVGTALFGCSKSAPSVQFNVINMHEHMESEKMVPKVLSWMRQNRIESTVLLGSPKATFELGGQGFSHFENNNEMVLKVAKKYPTKFIAFPTVNPSDPKLEEKLTDYLKQGAKGIKLYGGHGNFHKLPLDSEAYLKVYEFCRKNSLPIIFHVNLGLFHAEFDNVLHNYPDLKIICPHFCLSSGNLPRLQKLLDTYPNLFTDISFGYLRFLHAGFKRISKNSEQFRQFFDRYRERIFFGTDMVVTSAEFKDAWWMNQVADSYRQILEKPEVRLFFAPHEPLRGLSLDRDILDRIYYENAKEFIKN